MVTPEIEKASEVLNRSLLEIGGQTLSLQVIISAAIILVLAFFAAWGVRWLVRRAQVRLGEERVSSVYIAGQVARYLIVIAGISMAISTLGVDLSALSLFAGALGVGIGLGLQDVVKNFVCGLILLFDRSIEIGDYIELEDKTSGSVTSIGPRATLLLTNDNVNVLIPNANLLNGKMTNWTRNRATRRVHIPFSVAYGSDKDMVKKAALEAANSVAFTMPSTPLHKTQVWLTAFGSSSLHFELVVWPTLEAVKRPGSMQAAYCWALDDALRKYGIEIPFPQHDLRIRGLFGLEGQEARRAMRMDQQEAGVGDDAPQSPSSGRDEGAAQSVNDAAQDIERH